MKTKLGSGLIWLNLLVLLLLVTFWVSWDAPRYILGISVLLLLPGYTLLLALLPRQGDLKGIERFVLSLGTSLAISGLGGVILNYAAWGITAESTVYSLAVFIGVTSLIAFFRRQRLKPEERYHLELFIVMRGWYQWLLGAVIVGTLGLLVYGLAEPKLGESYTEFYILGSQSQAADYPKQLNAGEASPVVIGVINHEHQATEYRVEVRLGSNLIGQLASFGLEDGQTKEQQVGFTAEEIGEGQKLQFLLFKDGGSLPYRELHLFVDIS